jgi:UDP-N-acetylmuramoyl-L-alanyl-D-glutamate--2,6-diaminopimelate ligase
MQLKNLLRHVPYLSIEGPSDLEITGISYDARQVAPGMLYFAMPGVNEFDSIAAAVKRGAAAIVCERNGFFPQRTPRVKVRDIRESLAQAAAVYFENPGAKLKMIGVTGTHGKTSVAFMVKHILEQAGLSTGLISTIRHEIGGRFFPAHRKILESSDLQQMLAQMVRSNCDACVVEVSAEALERRSVCGSDYDIGVFTHFNRDPGASGDGESVFEKHQAFFEDLKHGGKKAGAVINIDDMAGRQLSNFSTMEIQMTYGLDTPARLRATVLEMGRKGTRMRIKTPSWEFECHLPVIGRHNVYNALAAAGTALVMNLPVPEILGALNTMPGTPGRLESVSAGQPFEVYVDYARDAVSLEKVLETLRELTPGRLLLAFGCRGGETRCSRFQMGKIAAEWADYCILTSDNPREESAGKIAMEIEEGFRSKRKDGYGVELDRRWAIDELLRQAQPGDAVLIAGKGHETYQEYEYTVVPFDDRVYARETLELLGHVRHEEIAPSKTDLAQRRMQLTSAELTPRKTEVDLSRGESGNLVFAGEGEPYRKRF